MKEYLVDICTAIFIATIAIVFGTNAVTTEWNVWALMVRFGGL